MFWTYFLTPWFLVAGKYFIIEESIVYFKKCRPPPRYGSVRLLINNPMTSNHAPASLQLRGLPEDKFLEVFFLHQMVCVRKGVWCGCKNNLPEALRLFIFPLEEFESICFFITLFTLSDHSFQTLMVSSGERYLFLVTIDFRYFMFIERFFFCQSPLLLLEYSCSYYWFGVTFYILRYYITFCYVCWHIPNIFFIIFNIQKCKFLNFSLLFFSLSTTQDCPHLKLENTESLQCWATGTLGWWDYERPL